MGVAAEENSAMQPFRSICGAKREKGYVVSSHGGAATTRANQIAKRAHCHAKNDLF